MKVADISPKVTDWKLGQTRKVSSWRFVDSVEDGLSSREVFHYDTLMGIFMETPQWGWCYEPISIGWGSVSDQKGINQLQDEWYYSRKGGEAIMTHKQNDEIVFPEYDADSLEDRYAI